MWRPLLLLFGLARVGLGGATRLRGLETRRELEPQQQANGGCRAKPFEDAGEGWQLKSADILSPGQSAPNAFGPDFAWGAGTYVCAEM